jgi:hypothetical protein
MKKFNNISKNAINIIITLLAIFVFYLIKYFVGIYAMYPIKYTSFFSLFFVSFATFFNIIFAFIFYIKLLKNKKSIKKAKQNMYLFLLLVIANMIISDAMIYFGYTLLNISLLVVNLVIFFTLLMFNKATKKHLLKPSVSL